MTKSSSPWKSLKWVVGFLFWSLIGLSFASQFYVSSSKLGLDITWRQALSYSLADWYVYALISIPIAAFAKKFPLERNTWKIAVVLHLIGCVVASLVYMVVRTWIAQAQGVAEGKPVGFQATFNTLLIKTYLFNFLVYWVIVTVSHALQFYRELHERELRSAELEKRLVQARLQALQMQLNPHFLFNTLHSISSLMHKDVDAADRMIARFSDLLRYALESTNEHEVPLRQELDFLRRYLDIEKTRFGRRLETILKISPETLEAYVPNLILQPIVENAIQHGIEPHSKPGNIEITSEKHGDNLVLSVSDNGTGVKDLKSFDGGVGLTNTRSRLQQIYNEMHRIEFLNREQGGLEVRILIPFRQSALVNQE